MKQQHTLMLFDPATGDKHPYPSHADQWRGWHGKMTAWLINPWTGTRRDAADVGSDPFGQLIQPPGESLYSDNANLGTVAARYSDLLTRLGVLGHDGAVAEISKLRKANRLDAATLSDSDIKRIVLSNTHPSDNFYAAFLNEEELIETGRRIAQLSIDQAEAALKAPSVPEGWQNEIDRLKNMATCGCGDMFTEHDPGICGNCVAAMKLSKSAAPNPPSADDRKDVALRSARTALIEANDIIDATWDCSPVIAEIDAAMKGEKT